MPVHAMPRLRLPDPDSRAFLDNMPGTDIPVIRQPFQAGDLLPFWSVGPAIGDHQLYSLPEDPLEEVNRVGDPLEAQMKSLLRHALADVEAPEEQFQRLGLS